MRYMINELNYDASGCLLHRHTNYEVIYYVTGSGTLHAGENVYPVKKGTIAVIPPKTEHGTVQTENLKCITSKEIESVIKSLPTQKSQGPNRFNHPQKC